MGLISRIRQGGAGEAMSGWWDRQPSGTKFVLGVLAFIGAVLLLYLYRRFVQHRGITGPSARRLPPRV